MKTIQHKNTILRGPQITQKIRRIAFEIYEHNFDESKIVLAGIKGQGYALAKLIKKQLSIITSIDLQIVKISMNKPASLLEEVKIDCPPETLQKKSIIIIDDVLHTGKTLACSIKPFLQINVKKIQVGVLIHRSHALFPIQPTYTGLQLSTTLNESVEVIFTQNPVVYLY